MRSDTVFAVDPPAQQAVADLFFDASEPVPGEQPWLLVDAAIVGPNALLRACEIHRWQMQSAFEQTRMGIYDDHAPALLAWEPQNQAQTRQLQDWIAACPVPAFSVVRATVGLKALRATLAYLGCASADGQPLYCRFADTRVLPNLLAQLRAPQAARLATAVAHWAWIDHRGQRRSWARAASDEAPDTASAIDLSASQFAKQMRASEPDTHFCQLLETVPSLVPAMERGAFRDRIDTALLAADAHGVEDHPDRLQFVVLALTCGESFHQHPQLQPTWQALRERRSTLAEAMTQWDATIWEQLKR